MGKFFRYYYSTDKELEELNKILNYLNKIEGYRLEEKQINRILNSPAVVKSPEGAETLYNFHKKRLQEKLNRIIDRN